jgi:hypothetical protein
MKKLTDPETGGGGFVRAKFSKAHEASGYDAIVSFNGNIASIYLYRFDNYNLDTGDGAIVVLCHEVFDTNGKVVDKLRIRAARTSIKVFYLDEQICSVKDATYKKGHVALMTWKPFDKPVFKGVTIVSPD